MCQNLSPIGLLVYKLVIKVKLWLQIFKTMEDSEFRVLIKYCFLLGEGGNTIQAKQWLDKCYLDFVLLETAVKRRYTVIQTQMVLNAQVAKIRQLSQKTPKNFKLVLANLKLKSYEIAKELKTSEGSVFTILH